MHALTADGGSREFLQQNYDFHCVCACCAQSEAGSRASDRRLGTMTDLYARLAEWGNGAIDGHEAIGLVRRIWDVGEEEGYHSERGRLAADAVLVAAAHSE